MSGSFLIVDLDRHASETLRGILEKAGGKVRAAYDPSELSRAVSLSDYSAAVVDPGFPRVEGARVMDYLRVKAPDMVMIPVAGSEEDKAVIKREAGDVQILMKPYNPSAVLKSIQIAGESARSGDHDFAGMIGRSDVMLAVYDTVRRVAVTGSSALICGETGTGKELVAEAIHKLGARRGKKFVTINCGALSESLLESELFGHEKGAFTGAIRTKVGKFESADGGTVFLDEIGEISHAVQVKLLRVIETGEIERLGSNKVIRTDVRMIFATNRDLAADVKNGRFREDLYYRINVFPIRTPSLRERKEDIPVLAGHFLSMYSKRHGKNVVKIEPDAMRLLMDRKWMGNVRELENTIERAVIVSSGPEITRDDIAPGAMEEMAEQGGQDFSTLTHKEMRRKVMSLYEERYFRRLMEDCRGNISLAARRAGLDRKTMYTRLAAYGINPAESRRPKND